MGSRSAPLIITKYYDYLLYLLPQVIKYPKSYRYTLGSRLENTSFDVLEILLEAVYSKNKATLLKQANIKIEKLRYFVRLSKDLKVISLKKYEVISNLLNEIGSQLGGWIKQQGV